MKNRQKYITERNEYDLLINIMKHSSVHDCPLHLVSNMPLEEKVRRCFHYVGACEACIQKWLNEEG